MIKKIIKDFDIQQIADSGQCFRLHMVSNGKYALIARERYLEISQENEEVLFSCDEQEFEKIWRPYFDLDSDYRFFKDSIEESDLYMRAAAKYGQGIRILRQDLWEMIVTFIISQQNNIPRIKKCVELLCTQFGEERNHFRQEKFYTFPRPEVLAALPEDGLSNCNLGYRARYLLKTARMVSSGEISLALIEKMNYEDARKELLKLCGVGVKVADCISLFALHHIDAFPIDTHIQNVLAEYYPEGFPFGRYQGFAGVLQQYAFYYDLHGTESSALLPAAND